jgi:hypothetical protein
MTMIKILRTLMLVVGLCVAGRAQTACPPITDAGDAATGTSGTLSVTVIGFYQ